MNELYGKIGNLLKQERLHRKLELSTISNELKISETNLGYVEDGSASKLPAELYFMLFAKSYATYLGIDYTRTVDAIREEIGEREAAEDAERAANAPPPAPPERSKKSRFQKIEENIIEPAKKSSWVLILIFIVLGILGLALFRSVTDKTEASNGSSVSPRVRSSSNAGNSNEQNFNPPLDSISGLTLSIMTRVQSSAMILADGDTVINGDLVIGKDYQIDAEEVLIISIGIPEAVDIRLNGKKADLSDPGTRRATRVEVNRSNYTSFLMPEEISQSQSDTMLGRAGDTLLQSGVQGAGR